MKRLTVLLLLFVTNCICQKIDSSRFNIQFAKLKNKNSLKSHLEDYAQLIHANPRFDLENTINTNFQKNLATAAMNEKNLGHFAHANLSLGFAMFKNESSIKALPNLLKSEKALIALKDTNCLFFCTTKIANIYGFDQKTDLELIYIEKAIKLAHKNNTLISQSLATKGNWYMDHNQYKEALLVFKKASSLSNINQRSTHINNVNIGLCLLKLGQEAHGVGQIEKTLKEIPSKDYSYTDYQIYLRSELIKYYIKHKNLKQVDFHFLKMKDYTKSSEYTIYTQKWFKNTRFLVQKAHGQYRNGLAILEQIKLDYDTATYNQYVNQLALTKAEIAQKEQKQLAENRALKSKNEKNQIAFWLLSALGLGSLGFGFYVFKTNKHLNKKNRELLEKNKEITEAMLKGQTIERQRVAQDLHDNLGSTLSGLMLNFEAMDMKTMSASNLEVYKNLKENLEKSYHEIRLLSHNLLPETFEKLGLFATLQGFVRKLNKNTSIEFDLQIEEGFDRQTKQIEFEIYCICLELVNNIIKHSKASQASILLSKTEKHIEVLIKDNGIGIFNNESDGKGLKNVQARVSALNGHWEVDSIESKGTNSIIKIPYQV